MAERIKARKHLAETELMMEGLRARVGTALPMLGNHEVELEALVRIRNVRLGRENLVGTRLPVLEQVELEVRDYGFIAKPHWVDRLVDELIDADANAIAEIIAGKRLHPVFQPIVDLRDGSTVEHGTIDFAAGQPARTVAVGPVDPARTTPFGTVQVPGATSGESSGVISHRPSGPL